MTPEKKSHWFKLNNSLLSSRPLKQLPMNPHKDNNAGVVVQVGNTCYYYSLFNCYYVNTGYVFNEKDIEGFENHARSFDLTLDTDNPKIWNRANSSQATMVFTDYIDNERKELKKLVAYKWDYLNNWDWINEVRDKGYATTLSRNTSDEYDRDLITTDNGKIDMKDLLIEKETYKINP